MREKELDDGERRGMSGKERNERDEREGEG
jgi:hypothetical protein